MTLKHPFNVMRHADWDAAPRMPQAIGMAIAAVSPTLAASGIWLAAGAGATFISYAQIVGYVAYSALTAAALRALAPDASAQNKGQLINAREPAATQEYVYGQVRKGGNITFMESTGAQNKYLHVIISLAGHECEEIGDIYINDEVVTVDGSGFVAGRWANKIRIKKHDGSQTTADADLVSETSVTDTFVGNGIAYIYARFEYDTDVFAGGIPTITAVIKGKKVYDPRSDTTAYSSNAALCIRDYLISSEGLNDSNVNDTYFSAAANDCDDDIALNGGGTEKRYTINGVINSANPVGTNLRDMVVACNGSLFVAGGTYMLKVGVYDASVKSFTLDDLRSEIDLQTRHSRSDSFNRVTGKFVQSGVYNAETNPIGGDWVETDYPAIESTDFLAEDGGNENTLDLPLLMTTSAAAAQRIAKQTLFRMREQMTFTAEFGLEALDVTVGDIVDLTVDAYGWDQKEFEVGSWALNLDPERGVTVTMTLREISEDAFQWSAIEASVIKNNTTLLDYTTAPAVGISLAPGLQITNEKVTNKLKVTTTSSSPSLIDYVEVQTKYSGSEDVIDGAAVAQGILRAAVGANPLDVVLFEDNDIEGRSIGDITNNGTVSSTDALEYLKYIEGAQTNQTYLDYIHDVMHPYILSNSEAYKDYLSVQLSIDDDWRTVSAGDLGLFEYLDAPAGQYDVRARSVNHFGIKSAWTERLGYLLSDQSPTPNDVSNFRAEANDGTIILSWDAVAALDLSYYEIRYSTDTSSPRWADSSVIVEKVSRPATNVSIAGGRGGAYLIKAVSKVGRQSQNATTVAVEADSFQTFTNNASQAEHSTFSGTKTSTSVVSGALELTSPTILAPDGSYIFSTDIDVGADKRVFSYIDSTFTRRNTVTPLFDGLKGNIDSLPGLWDDLSNENFGDINLRYYIAVKEDGGSVFGDYRQFNAGYFYGRYFRFKVVLESGTSFVTPSITSLTAHVGYN